MVVVTARRSRMPRKTTRKRQVSTLESVMEWFQRKKTSGGTATAVSQSVEYDTFSTVVATTRETRSSHQKQTTTPAVTVTPPTPPSNFTAAISGSSSGSPAQNEPQRYPVKRSSLGFLTDDEGRRRQLQPPLSPPPSVDAAVVTAAAAAVPVSLAQETKPTTKPTKETEATHSRPIQKKRRVTAKHAGVVVNVSVPHKTKPTSSSAATTTLAHLPQRSLVMTLTSSLLSSPLQSLASSLTISTMKLFPTTRPRMIKKKQPPSSSSSSPPQPPMTQQPRPRGVMTTTTTTTTTTTEEHSEVMAVSHALHDAVQLYLQDHPDLSTNERNELIHWAKTTHTQLRLCDQQIMGKIHAGDQIQWTMEKNKLRDEILTLQRVCRETELHAQASRLLFQMDALR